MGKTYSCSFEGCDMVFSRDRDLKKHIIFHTDPSRLFNCILCPFHTLNPRNLKVHFAIHTGEKIYECPDTVQVNGPSGDLAEAPCNFRTNDRSVLTKHRGKKHGYTPRPRAAPQRALAFIPYYGPSSSTTTSTSVATSDATSGVSKSKRVRKQNATSKRSKSSSLRGAGEVDGSTGDAQHGTPDGSVHSTLQEGVDEHEQRGHVDSPDATGSSPVGSSSAISFAPNEYTLLDAHEQQTYVESLDAIGTPASSSSDTTSVVPNEGIPLDTDVQWADVEPSHAAGSSSITTTTPNQGISIDALFDPATDLALSGFSAQLDFTLPQVAAVMERWNESDWNDYWGGFQFYSA